MDVLALANVVTDITFQLSEKDLERFGFKKGALNTSCREEESFQRILSALEIEKFYAGSAANVVFNLSAYGYNNGLIGVVGNDPIGDEYIDFVQEYRVKPFISRIPGSSAVCYVIVTPDGERTFYTKIGVANRFRFGQKDFEKAKFFHTSGYELIDNPEKTMEAIYFAKSLGSRVSFDLAGKDIVHHEIRNLENLLRNIDILFATKEEGEALTGIRGDNKRLVYALGDLCPTAALKLGERGSIVYNRENLHIIPPFPVDVVNTCGAGDAYTAGFLMGMLQDLSIDNCGMVASYFGSRICGMRESHF